MRRTGCNRLSDMLSPPWRCEKSGCADQAANLTRAETGCAVSGTLVMGLPRMPLIRNVELSEHGRRHESQI